VRRAFSLIEAMVVLAIIAIIAGIIVALVAHENGIHAGYVVGKEHHDAYTTFILVGKTVVPQHHPERWELNLVFEDKTNDWDVGRMTYDAATPGMWYDHDTDTLSAKPVPEGKP
jgi:prepilin-type N-terminal cleavage/methylation domain-containing protein